MEAGELDQILAQAQAIAEKYKISRAEALLLMAVHEAMCLHFHVDSGFVLGAIRHVDDKGTKQQ